MTEEKSIANDTPVGAELPAGSPAWLRARLKRHLSEMTRLAVPVMATRLGMWALALVDTAVVGQYATDHLAWLNMANQTVIMMVFVASMGLLMGVQVQVSQAFGQGDFPTCARIWRRTLPYAGLISIGIVIICSLGEFWLSLLGIEDPLRSKAASLIRIIGYALPFQLLFAQTTMFFEGINRPMVCVWVMVIANGVNLAADIILVHGIFLPEPLGAQGAAWATTIVRITMAATLIGYYWFSPSLKDYRVREKPTDKWQDWSKQRRIGYAQSLSMTAEIAAFAALAVFAGWLSTEAVAAHGVIFAIIGVPLMLSVGIGVATSVRVGVAYGRGDQQDTALAGYVGLGFGLILMTVMAIGSVIYIEPLLSLFTKDAAVVALIVPIALIFCTGLVFDAGQMIASGGLRGLGETWWPTGIQVFAFNIIMVPLCYLLAVPFGWGIKGLFAGTLIACVISLVLQMARFFMATRSGLIKR